MSGFVCNRVSGQFVHGSQQAAGCRCGWPWCVARSDEVVTPVLKTVPGMMTVDRAFDCVLHGPWVQRLVVPAVADAKIGAIYEIDEVAQRVIEYPWDRPNWHGN